MCRTFGRKLKTLSQNSFGGRTVLLNDAIGALLERRIRCLIVRMSTEDPHESNIRKSALRLSLLLTRMLEIREVLGLNYR